ncbi:MAG: hypothetical protein HYV28_12170 [Ignavibacteriales bacterium]|nr:hypothetical protein [Ignavibacteriales bacterium]
MLEGTVQTYSSPRKGIADAVISRGSEVLAKTNSAGYFVVNYTQPVDGWYVFQRDGYAADSLFISWSGANKKSIDILLNQIPTLDSLFVYSSVESNVLLPETKVKLVVMAKVSDKDNDIDSVFVENNPLSFHRVLPYNVNDKLFENLFYATDLNVGEIADVIGTQLSVIVKDAAGRKHSIGSGYLKRILTEPLTIDISTNQDSSNTPDLKWFDIPAAFDYTQMVQIFTDELFPTLAWQKAAIPSDSTHVKVDKTLSSGKYFWMIWCIDNNQNRISSLRSSLIVK